MKNEVFKKTILLEPYYGELHIFVCTEIVDIFKSKKFINIGRNRRIGSDWVLDSDEVNENSVGIVYNLTPWDYVLILQNRDNRGVFNGTIAHESLHIVQRVLDNTGMVLSEETDEAYAYLLGYIVDNIYIFLNDKKISTRSVR